MNLFIDNEFTVEDCLKGLRLYSLLPDSGEILLDCERQGLPPKSTALVFLGTAYKRRQGQRQEMQIKMARFPSGATIENFDFTNIGQSSAKLVEELLDCDWIRNHENLLFNGAPGLGKTHLSIALGKRAVAQGYRTLFIEATDLFGDLRRWNKSGELEAKLKNLRQVKLLIIDDIGFTIDSSPEDATLFYSLIHSRYGNSSTIITSNRPLLEWLPAMSGDDTSMRAAIDRFIHRCHVIKLIGKSYRLQQFESRQGQRPDDSVKDIEGAVENQ